MGKLLFWVLILLCVLFAARLVTHHNRKASISQAPRQRVPEAKPGPAESMVRCAHCGIHLPRSDALLVDGKTWCSQAHADLGPRT